jgi:hypothetical protein
MHIRSFRHPISALVALVLTLSLAGGVAVAAQDTSSPPPDLSGAIAQGTCDAPGQASIQVGDFIRIDDSEVVGSQEIEFTLRTQRNVDSSLDALFGPTPHVFIVTDNADPGAGPVACGALGGVNVNGQITIALTTPDQEQADRDLIVGVAIFGATTPSGPTTQPAVQPGQLPVQAYLSENALTPPEVVETTVPPTPTPTTAPATPTAAPSTPEPTMMPTMAPTAPPTMAPTMPPTAPPTMPPTVPSTVPPTVDATVT